MSATRQAALAEDLEALGLRLRSRPTQRHPWLYRWAVLAHRARRHVRWLRSDVRWATACTADALPSSVMRHSSPLIRELSSDQPVQPGQPDPMALQRGKVVNLRLAAARTDGLVIAPGETFSFNRVVGSCTRRKGYVEGMRLANGVPVAGVGGGVCQLANLVHWLFLHSPLIVEEWAEHSYDPFPDKDRTLPWGVGCSIAWNYVDLVLRNDSDLTFRLHTWVDDGHLRGELQADRPLDTSYQVEARSEEFLRVAGTVYRRNEIWRTTTEPGWPLTEERLRRSCAVVRYLPPEDLIRDLTV